MKKGWTGQLAAWRGALEKYKYVLLVMAAGAVLLLLPLGSAGGEQENPGTAAGTTQEFDLETFEEKLEQALSQVQGAGDVKVVLSIQTGQRQILAEDQEQDGDGAYHTATVTLGRGSGNQEVVPLQTVAPQFRGALVVCPGGGDPKVRLDLAQAVGALTGLGADRITICQGNM